MSSTRRMRYRWIGPSNPLFFPRWIWYKPGRAEQSTRPERTLAVRVPSLRNRIQEMDDSQRAGEAAGKPLQAGSAPGPDADAGHLPFVPLRLVLRPGTTAVELTRPDMLVGRHTEADIRLSLPDVSRRHCRLVYAAGRWQIFDLNSLD